MSLNFDREVRRVGRRKGECDLIKSVQGRVKARCVWAISERHGQRQPRPGCTWAPMQFEGVQGNSMIFLKAVNVGSFASTCVNLYEFLVHVSNSVYAEPTDKVLKWKHEGRVAGRRGGKKLALTLLPPGGTLQQHLRAAAAVWLQQRGLLCCIACWRGGRARGLSAYCTTSSSWRLRLWSLHAFKFQRGRGRGKKWMN